MADASGVKIPPIVPGIKQLEFNSRCSVLDDAEERADFYSYRK